MVANAGYLTYAYMSPDGRRFIYHDGFEGDIGQLKVNSGARAILFEPEKPNYHLDTHFAVSASDNRIVFENHDDIFALALDEIKASASGWEKFE